MRRAPARSSTAEAVANTAAASQAVANEARSARTPNSSGPIGTVALTPYVAPLVTGLATGNDSQSLQRKSGGAMTSTTPTDTTRHPLFARIWPRLGRQLDRQGAVHHRRRLVAGLQGRVIDVGAGDGANFAHYPESVTEVVAVEPEPYLRERAQQAAQQASVPVTVTGGLAEKLPGADGGFDAAVTSLVLCSVTDLPTALNEIRRVLAHGGRLRFFEHVVAEGRAHRWLQQTLDATIWPRMGGGCHTARDTPAAIERAGFELVSVERFRFPDGRLPVPTSPHVFGDARVR